MGLRQPKYKGANPPRGVFLTFLSFFRSLLILILTIIIFIIRLRRLRRLGYILRINDLGRINLCLNLSTFWNYMTICGGVVCLTFYT